MEANIYTPHQRLKKSFIGTLKEVLHNIITYRELIIQLFKRDFFKVYKKSFLGISWILITPLIAVVSWIIMNSSGILNPGDVGVPYPAFVLISTSIWGLFTGFYNSAQGTLEVGKSFIQQVKYPHEVLLVKQLLENVVNFFITFIFNLGVLLLLGVHLNVAFLLLPILILPLLFLGAGAGLIVSVFSIVAVDVANVVSRLLNILLFFTPVVYADSDNELLSQIIKYNPLTYLISCIRDLMFYGTYDYMGLFFLISFISFGFFLICLRIFYISEPQVIEKII